MSGNVEHRFRFSLRRVFFLVTFVAMGITIWQLYLELKPLRDEVLQLRGEAGYLVVREENRDRLHGIEIDTGNPLFWKWKVFLPEGQDYWLGAHVGILPPKGEVPEKPGPVSNSASYRHSSEQVVEVSVIRNFEGKLVLRQQLGGISTEEILSAEQEEILSFRNTSNGRAPSAGQGGTSFTSSANEPLTLKVQERRDHNNPNAIVPKSKGIFIWIEPVQDEE